MVWFNIISLEEFENYWNGITKIGDVLETVQQESLIECKKYVYEKYGPYGENIKVKIKRCDK